MATLEGNKIKDTFKALLKVNNNGELNETLQEVTDGDGNGSGILINTSGDLRAEGTLEFGNLKDTAENITISKLVDQADGIANNDNDTSIPTSAAVKDYVDTNVTAQDLDFTGDSGTGAVDLDSQTLNLVGTNGVVTTASGQTITIDTSSLDSRLTTAESNISSNDTDIVALDTRLTTAEGDIDTNTADITSEETARIAADNTLQSNIDSEAATRLSADNTLQSNITSEAATRLANDNTLQANIDSEASTRATADTTLQSNINAEAATRLANDNTLQANINTEEAARIAADTTLQSNIDSEETARIAADAVLQGGIDAEGLTRQAADADLQSQIDSNDTDISNLQSSKQDISEKGQANGYAPLDSGAKIPIANLPDSVVGQVEYQGTWNASTDTPSLPAATGVKGHYYVVATAGTYETISYAIGDWVISNGTSWEKVDNTDAVTTVFGRLGAIVANESDYSAYYPLIADLTAEESARIAADNTLQTNIDTEASTRASADTTLQGNIDTEETARIAGDANLQSQIDTINLDNVDGTGTANYIAKWTDGDTIGNSVIYDNGTNVGIGTEVTTAAKLVIQTSGDQSIYGSTTGGYNVLEFTSDNGTTVGGLNAFNGLIRIGTANGIGSLTGSLNIDSNGNVGIGTDTIPFNGLRINGTGSRYLNITSGNGASAGILFGDQSDTFDGGIVYSNADQSLIFYSADAERMRIDSQGNVIIQSGFLRIQDGSAAAPSLNVGLDVDTGLFRPATNTIGFTTAGTERMRITSGGNVGIGTSSPSTKFEVNQGSDNNGITLSNSARGAGRIEWELSGLTNGGHKFIHNNGTDENVMWYSTRNVHSFYINNAEKMRIDNAGNVGINESSPLGKLHITKGVGSGASSVNANADELVLESDGLAGLTILTPNTGQGRIHFGDPESQTIGKILYNHTYDSMVFQTNNSDAITIDSSGNVGIGTSSPAAKLEIGGAGEGIILASPNGTKYKITVTDVGVLTTTAV